jgi:hypothetical protein
MTDQDPKADLRRYLTGVRADVLWKLDGLSEYDVRRPMTPTGTNLLGLVKHLAHVEAGYFGMCFGRPYPEPLSAWDDDAEANADMWARADESRADVVGFYRRACAHADETIEALPLTAVGNVPWWSSAGEPTLHRVLVHVIAETNRHAGHADLLRELIDGEAGLRAANSNLPPVEPGWWEAYRERLEQAAAKAAGL